MVEVSMLKRSTPEQQGVSSEAILNFIEAAEKMRTKEMDQDLHSFMLLRHGYVVAEGWWEPYRRELSHMLFSLSKSFTSTAVGFAVDEGLLTVEDKVVTYFPEECKDISGYLGQMRIKDLLSMGTGHIEDTMMALDKREDGNWVKAFFEVPVEKEPGTHFKYNTGATYMVSVIIQKVTGMKLIDYLRPRLFTPLGIQNPTWEECPMGYNTGGFGLNITTEDIAKFGQLYLNEGKWEGKQLISKAWIEEATTSQISNGDDPESDWSQGYGYQFWRCKHNAYRADGAFGQFCFVLPEQEVVLAITAGMKDTQGFMNLIWEHLLPGFRSEALEESPLHKKLEDKLSALAVLMPEKKVRPEIFETVIGKRFRLEKNPFEFELVSFQLDNEDIVITYEAKNVKQELRVGCGRWLENHIQIAGQNNYLMVIGTWVEERSYLIQCRAVNTPFAIQVIFDFKDEGLLMKVKNNLGFEEKKWEEFAGECLFE